MKVIFDVKCPLILSGSEGEEVTMYKNPNGLYVVIKKGQEVGLASNMYSKEEKITKKDVPNSLIGYILSDFIGTEFKFATTI